MNAAYEKLIQHLDNKSIGYWPRHEDQSICTDLRGDVGTYRVFARVEAENSLFQVFGYSPVRVPPGARSVVAETVVRANHGLKVGKFELDFDEGDLYFQSSQILPEGHLDDEIIHRLIGTTMSMLDIYLPAIMSVIYGNELPIDAVKHAEPGRSNASEGSDSKADE